MPFGDYSTPALAMFWTIIAGVATAIIPIFNAELFIIFLGTVASRRTLPMLVVVFSVAHMVGKTVLYLAGRLADRLPEGWLRRKVDRARPWIEKHDRVGGAMLLASGLIGFPPFYLVTIAAGVVRMHFVTFFASGLVGRLARFAVIASFPQLIKAGVGR
jgi:membrane protein YqaA with SNARE-associated domain